MATSQATEQIPIMSAAIEITDATFEADVLRSPTLTILDLWAEWCMPCKRLAPILDEISTEYAGKIKVVKLDVDANARTPGMYNVTGIPTLLVFKGGKLVETLVGFMPKDKVLAKVLPHVN
jgi:thioredoxin 1